MTSLKDRIEAKKTEQAQSTGAVTSLAKETKLPTILRFITQHAGFNYRFRTGKVAIFKASAGQYTYVATPEEAAELREKAGNFVFEAN
jgi:hypothetical protein